MIARTARSIGHALAGVRRIVREELNARIHLAAALLAVIVGALLRLAPDEWRWLALACALVWSAEAFNSAIERLADRVCPTHDPLIGAAKDCAAAAVLITALAALAIALTLVLPRLAGATP